MHGVIIRDSSGNTLNFDLKDIVAVLGERTINSYWLCSGDFEYTSEADIPIEALDNAYDRGERIKGSEFINIIKRLIQVIDGTFEAFEINKKQPWVIIRAIDSSWWEVFSNEPVILDNIRARFNFIEEIESK